MIRFAIKIVICFPLIFISTSLFAKVFEVDKLILFSEAELNGKKAYSFYFGGTQTKYCDVTATSDYIKVSHGVMTNTRRNQPELEVSCTVDGKYYVISSKHESKADFTIYLPTDQDTAPTLVLRGRLVTMEGEVLLGF